MVPCRSCVCAGGVTILLFLVGYRSSFVLLEKESWTKSRVKTTSSTAMNHGAQDTNDTGKPIFVLHVGPGKTATTFVQSQLCWKPEMTEPLLLKDNFVYLGKCSAFKDLPHRSKYHPYLDRSNSLEGNIVPEFYADVDELHAAGRNVIFSNEDFSFYNDAFIRDFAELFASSLNAKFQVKVLVGHRSLYELLPSTYNEVAKVAETFRQWPGVRLREMDSDSWQLAKKVRKRPDQQQQGMPLVPFNPDDDDLPIIGDSLRRVKADLVHSSQRLAAIYGEYFDDVTILPLMNLPKPHTPLVEGAKVDPLFSLIFCDLLEAAETCKAIRKGQLEPPPKDSTNPSMPFNYDMIAVEAYESGLLPKFTTPFKNKNHPLGRFWTALRVQQRQEEVLNRTSIDFPLECLSDETLQRFEALSLAVDQKFFGQQWNSEWEEKHREGFEHAKEKLFCWVIASKVLEDKGWRDFFKSLSTGEE